MKSYKDIIKLINEFADKHLQVKHFEQGIPDDVNVVFDTFNKLYPCIWVQPVNFEIQEHTLSYNLNIHVFSLDHESRDNSTDVMSDMIFIANDLFNWLYLSDADFIGSESVTLNPLFYDLSERVSGVTMEISIQVNRENNKCNIPYE